MNKRNKNSNSTINNNKMMKEMIKINSRLINNNIKINNNNKNRNNNNLLDHLKKKIEKRHKIKDIKKFLNLKTNKLNQYSNQAVFIHL